MPHHVRDWMSSPVIVIDEDSSAAFAMTLMRRRNIRSLIVQLRDSTAQFGILTTTDIRDKIIAADRSPVNVCVREIMTAPVVNAREDWTLKQCSLTMHQHRINHLPVLNDNGDLVGIISTTDLFAAAEEIGWEETH